MKRVLAGFLPLFWAVLVPAAASAQSRAALPAIVPVDRVSRPVNPQITVKLPTPIPSGARPERDQGPVAAGLRFSGLILSLKRDTVQQAGLESLSDSLQDPQSPLFHRWLTPDEFGARFGASQHDLDQITDWLRSQGLTVDEIPAGRWMIIFSGTAAQVDAALHTSLHYFAVGTELRYSNTSQPEIPEAIAGIVEGVAGLDNLHTRSAGRPITGRIARADLGLADGSHLMEPSDFAAIYNINKLYAAGIKGNGVNIAVIEPCTMDVSLAQNFWNIEGIQTPGIFYQNYNATPRACTPDYTSEVYLDYEWAGAIAPQARTFLVSSGAADSLLGAVTGVVNAPLAPIITLSYGDCESRFYDQTWVSLWFQAHVSGITGMVSSGDTGPAGCDNGDASTATPGYIINGFCASPYSVCVGGTQFDDVSSPSLYWSKAGSALGYIPEVAWNESGTAVGGQGLWSSGGGYSQFAGRPSWQTANLQSGRGIPDVALTAAGHDAYRICDTLPLDCSSSSPYVYGASGTSASAPAFAAIMALLVQSTGQWQGNVNPTLYNLAARTDIKAFHDVTQGNNTIPGLAGFSAQAGWDPVTGLGSVDAAVLIANWPGGGITPPAVPTPPGPSIKLSAASLTFSNQSAGTTSSSQTVTLTNSGAGILTLSGITITGANASDFVLTVSCGSTVAPNGTCSFTVSFRPTLAGSRNASVMIVDNAAASPQIISLTGTGAGQTTSSFTNQRVTATPPFSSGCTVPPSATDFLTSNNAVYLFFQATLTTSDALTSDWLAPDGAVLPGTSWKTGAGTSCYSSSALLINSSAPGRLGTWQARVYDNGAPVFKVSFTVSQPAASPVITPGGVVPLYSSRPIIQPGEWISLYGTGFSTDSVQWNNDFPTTLGGVSVTIDGKSAYLWLVSPTQINLQVPDDTAFGTVPVVVTTNAGVAASTVVLSPQSPSFSLLDGKHVTGIVLRADGSGTYGAGTYDIIGPTGSSLGYPTVAARAGDVVELFGVGFGPTAPTVPAGILFSGAARTVFPVDLKINNVGVTPIFAGLSGSGLYQINFVVPTGLGTGDLLLQGTVNNVTTGANVFITLR